MSKIHDHSGLCSYSCRSFSLASVKHHKLCLPLFLMSIFLGFFLVLGLIQLRFCSDFQPISVWATQSITSTRLHDDDSEYKWIFIGLLGLLWIFFPGVGGGIDGVSLSLSFLCHFPVKLVVCTQLTLLSHQGPLSGSWARDASSVCVAVYLVERSVFDYLAYLFFISIQVLLLSLFLIE